MSALNAVVLTICTEAVLIGIYYLIWGDVFGEKRREKENEQEKIRHDLNAMIWYYFHVKECQAAKTPARVVPSMRSRHGEKYYDECKEKNRLRMLEIQLKNQAKGYIEIPGGLTADQTEKAKETLKDIFNPDKEQTSEIKKFINPSEYEKGYGGMIYPISYIPPYREVSKIYRKLFAGKTIDDVKWLVGDYGQGVSLHFKISNY